MTRAAQGLLRGRKYKHNQLHQRDYDSLYTGEAETPLRPLSKGTLLEIDRMWERWTRYCCLRPNSDPTSRLRSINLNELKRFITFLMDTGNILKLSTAFQRMRVWRMMYNQKLRYRLDQRLSDNITNFIAGTIKSQYELDDTLDDKPVADIDDCLVILFYLHAISAGYYSHERERVQHGLIIVLMLSTTARPSTLLEFALYQGSNESLKYKDIEIFKVRDPNDLTQQTFIMRLRLRLLKGRRNTGLAPKVLFFERDDTLSFCTILQVLSLAFVDKAFASEWLQSPEDLYSFSVPDHVSAVPIAWKPSMLETPLFRRPVSTNGKISMSHSLSAHYSPLARQTVRLGEIAGFKTPLHFYCFRRGGAEAIDKYGSPDLRNFVMGHARASIFERHYRNAVVQMDTQAAFLEVPSNSALTKLAGHMSLTRDPAVASAVQVTQAEVDRNPEISELKRQQKASTYNLRLLHGTVMKSRGTSEYNEHKMLMGALGEKRMRERRRLEMERRQRFFENAGTQYIDAQRRGLPIDFTPPIQPAHEFPERNNLARLLFERRDVLKMSADDIRERRVQVMHNLIALCGRRMARPAPLRVNPSNPGGFATIEGIDLTLDEAPTDSPDQYPLSCPGTQCLFCLGDRCLSPAVRMYCFSRKEALQRHMRQHFQTVDWIGQQCPHPLCDTMLEAEDHFKNHAHRVHNIAL